MLNIWNFKPFRFYYYYNYYYIPTHFIKLLGVHCTFTLRRQCSIWDEPMSGPSALINFPVSIFLWSRLAHHHHNRRKYERKTIIKKQFSFLQYPRSSHLLIINSIASYSSHFWLLRFWLILKCSVVTEMHPVRYVILERDSK